MTTSEQSTHIAATIEEMAAMWHRHPICQVIELDTGERACNLPAAWNYRRHGCSSGIICTPHLQHWRDKMSIVEFPDHCEACGIVFQRPEDYCTVTPI